MKKILLILFLTFAISTNFTSTVFAQEKMATPAPPKTAYPLNTNPDVPQNFHTYTQSIFIEILAGATCIFSGVDILSADGRCLGIDTATKKIGYVDQSHSIGLIEVTGNLIAATYNMPASSGTYVRYLASNFGVTRTSYAQFGTGIGYEGLEPVLNIWKVFRNLSYLAFVLIFVIIGLGIMFRLNIDARAVMSVQNQLPKIVLALALITLSYAIAGFLIDMMYLSIYLIANLFSSSGLATINNISNPYYAAGSLGGISKIAEPAAESVVTVFVSIFDGSFGSNIAKIVSGLVGTLLVGKAGGGIGGLVGGLIGGAVGLAAGGAGAGAGVAIGSKLGGYAGMVVGGAIGAARGPSIMQMVAGIIVYLVIMIAILSALFRVWFLLIKTYIFILLDVIFAPFFIMSGLLPGSPGGGFSSWFRSMLGNLAAFPTVLTLFLVGASIQNQLKDGDTVNNFIPPLVGSLSDDSARSIGSLIGLGIILIMPESVNIAKAMFKSPERKLASAIWQPVGMGQGALTKFVGNPLQKSLRKESDGTRGWIRGALEDTATKGLRKVGLDEEKLKSLPVVGTIMKNREENIRRRREHLYGAPSESSAGQDSSGQNRNRRSLADRILRRNSQQQQQNPVTDEAVDRELRDELRRSGVGEGIMESVLNDQTRKEELDRRREAIRQRLTNESRSENSPVATGPSQASDGNGNGGSGSSGGNAGGGINISFGGPNPEAVENAAERGAEEGTERAHERQAQGSGAGDISSAQDRARERVDDRENNGPTGGSSSNS